MERKFDIKNYRADYLWFYVPEDSFMNLWSEDVIDFEQAEDGRGWNFCILNGYVLKDSFTKFWSNDFIFYELTMKSWGNDVVSYELTDGGKK